MVTYRSFRNSDPPLLTTLWRSLAGEPAFFPRVTTEMLTEHVFGKQYFDNHGLILAFEGDQVSGCVHASFGPNETESAICYDLGTTSLIGVRPDCNTTSIAAGLLERSENYLRGRGAKVIYGGSIRPLNGFYFGLYGGSELPGVLESDAVAQQAYTGRGYREIDRTLLFHLNLSAFEAVVDRRQMQARRQMVVEVVLDPPPKTWWEASVLGAFELTRFNLLPRSGGKPVASATFRSMDIENASMQPSSIGLIDVWVEESSRRRGLALFLLSEAFRHLIRSGAKDLEVQAMQHNLAAHSMYRRLGFKQVAQGSVFRLD